MANTVTITFEGDARELFAKADAVEKRLNSLGMKASTAPSTMLSGAQTPALDRVIESQKNLTRTVETEAAKRATAEIASAKAVTRAVETETAKQRSAIASVTPPVSGASRLETFRQDVIQRQRPQSVDVTKGLVGNIAGGLASGQSPVELLSRQSEVLAEAFGRTAVSADAVAASTGKASASVTLMGASVVSLGAILAAGVVTILAVKKATDDIREAAEKRLKREEQITAEYNRQSLAIGDLSRRIKEASATRSFNTFATGDDVLGLKTGLTTRQQQRQQLVADVEFQRGRYNSLLQLPGLPADVLKQAFPKEAEDRLKALDNEIFSITERLAGLKQAQTDDYRNRVFGGVERQIAESRSQVEQNAIDAAKAAAEAEKKRVESIEKAKAKVVEMGQAFRGAFDSVTSRASAGNPFLTFLNDADKRMQNLRESTKGFSSSLRGALAQMEQASNRKDLIGLRIDASIQANDLRTQAREFRQGFRNDLSNPATLQQIVDQQLRAIGGRSAGDPIAGPTGKPIVAPFLNLDGSAIARTPLDPTQRSVQDQKLIDLAGRIDPAKLREDQRAAFADALEREAKRRLDAESNAQAERTKQSALLTSLDAEMKKLNALANTGGLDAIVQVIDESDLSNVTRQSKPSDTAGRRNR